MTAMDELLNNSPGGFLSITDDGTIALANETLSRWLGFGPQELTGQSIESILSIGGRIFYQTHIFPLLTLNGHADELYFALKCRASGTLPVLANAMRRERDGVLYNDFVFLPMRQRGEYEEELLRAKKVADDASQAKARFLSTMSHELRTPMNAILGFGQLLKMDELDELQMESVDQILRAGGHLLNLINEVLDLSRIEAGHADMALKPVPSGEVIGEALQMSRSLAMQAGIEIAHQVTAEDDLAVNADQGRLRQILLNLLANAIKYNRPGGTVTIVCERAPIEDGEGESPDEQRLRLVVRDTGEGIPPDKLDKLFTPFERLGAENTNIEGTGLGLALCQRLAKAMGGAIGVESTVGVGSRFWVELPIIAPAEPAPEEDKGATEVSGLPVATSLLLYIEDNADNLKLVQRILSKRPNIRLLPATNGEEGLHLARTHFPDLILLDLQLPELTGETVFERLRADERTRNIPVVVLSADATSRQIERLTHAGAEEYLTKPLDVTGFLQTLDKHLDASANSTNEGR